MTWNEVKVHLHEVHLRANCSDSSGAETFMNNETHYFKIALTFKRRQCYSINLIS